MAVLLSLAMVFGIFSGMMLDAEAREGKVYKLQDLKKGMVLYAGDNIDLSTAPQHLKGIVVMNEDGTKQLFTCSKDGTTNYCKLTSYKEKGVSYNTFICQCNYADQIIGYIYVSLSVTTFEEENTENTETPATLESHPIPASVAAVKDFYGKVKDAPANGTITYDSAKLYTISDYLLKKMSERSDVAVTINFEYQNAKYELTFPAGTDYTPVLTDEDTMYGYFGVAAKLGLTVVAK